MSAPTRAVWIVTALALLYSAVHFAKSGVIYPLSDPNLGKYEEETPALREHLRTGAPVHFDNAVQYGPIFFFIVHPLIVKAKSDAAFAGWLYALQIVCLVAAFVFTAAT